MSPSRRDSGFTLIELMVVLALMSVIAAISVGAWRSWAAAASQKGAAVDLQTILRQTEVRSVTEGVAFCVDFDSTASTYTVYRYVCGTGGDKVSGPWQLPPANRFTTVAFTKPDGSVASQATFAASGRAWPGTIVLKRDDASKSYTLKVEGLTGRVSIS